jgi:hypothetical protein
LGVTADAGRSYTELEVIQIAADPSYPYALCDDGQIFRLVNRAISPPATGQQKTRPTFMVVTGAI